MNFNLIFLLLVAIYQSLDLKDLLDKNDKIKLFYFIIFISAVPVLLNLLFWIFGHGPKIAPLIDSLLKVIAQDFYEPIKTFLFLNGLNYYCSERKKVFYYNTDPMVFLSNFKLDYDSGFYHENLSREIHHTNILYDGNPIMNRSLDDIDLSNTTFVFKRGLLTCTIFKVLDRLKVRIRYTESNQFKERDFGIVSDNKYAQIISVFNTINDREVIVNPNGVWRWYRRSLVFHSLKTWEIVEIILNNEETFVNSFLEMGFVEDSLSNNLNSLFLTEKMLNRFDKRFIDAIIEYTKIRQVNLLVFLKSFTKLKKDKVLNHARGQVSNWSGKRLMSDLNYILNEKGKKNDYKVYHDKNIAPTSVCKRIFDPIIDLNLNYDIREKILDSLGNAVPNGEAEKVILKPHLERLEGDISLNSRKLKMSKRSKIESSKKGDKLIKEIKNWLTNKIEKDTDESENKNKEDEERKEVGKIEEIKIEPTKGVEEIEKDIKSIKYLDSLLSAGKNQQNHKEERMNYISKLKNDPSREKSNKDLIESVKKLFVNKEIRRYVKNDIADVAQIEINRKNSRMIAKHTFEEGLSLKFTENPRLFHNVPKKYKEPGLNSKEISDVVHKKYKEKVIEIKKISNKSLTVSKVLSALKDFEAPNDIDFFKKEEIIGLLSKTGYTNQFKTQKEMRNYVFSDKKMFQEIKENFKDQFEDLDEKINSVKCKVLENCKKTVNNMGDDILKTLGLVDLVRENEGLNKRKREIVPDFVDGIENPVIVKKPRTKFEGVFKINPEMMRNALNAKRNKEIAERVRNNRRRNEEEMNRINERIRIMKEKEKEESSGKIYRFPRKK